MTPEEWDDMCDGCAKCCEFKGTGGIACPGLDTETNRCTVYEKRLRTHTCLKVDPDNTMELHERGILPDTCAYVRHMQGLEPLEHVEPAKLRPYSEAGFMLKLEYEMLRQKWLLELAPPDADAEGGSVDHDDEPTVPVGGGS
jgi:hypothetical protein